MVDEFLEHLVDAVGAGIVCEDRAVDRQRVSASRRRIEPCSQLRIRTRSCRAICHDSPYPFSLIHIAVIRGLWPLPTPELPDVVLSVMTPLVLIVAPPSLKPESHIASQSSCGRHPTGSVPAVVSPMFPDPADDSPIVAPVLLN